MVSPERLAAGALYPPIGNLREISRQIAISMVAACRTVDGELVADGEMGTAQIEAAVDGAVWWPEYQRYEPA